MSDTKAAMELLAYEVKIANLRYQLRWTRKMLRRAEALICTDLDDEAYVAEWLVDLRRGSSRRGG